MKVGVIGAGFTGLAAAYYLSKSGHQVTVLERDSQPGGLAIGFKDASWEWFLEAHYHHLFESDWAIRNLASEIGHPINFTRPITSTYYSGNILQLDSPISLLKFSHLPLFDRLRTAFGLALMRFNPFWQPFELMTAQSYIKTILGQKSWEVLWQPLFEGKFGSYTPTISASWFWARIFKRSPSLGYPEGGFQSLAQAIEKAAKGLGAKFIYSCSLEKIDSKPGKSVTCLTDKSKFSFDKVISTLPTILFEKVSGLTYSRLNGLGAVNLVLALKKQFLKDGTYWLNINDRSMPFLCTTEHTNFINSRHYAGDHLLYVGNYLPSDHKFFKLSDKELLKLFTPHLKKINSNFSSSWVRKSWIFKAPFAQPIVTTRYSKLIPPMVTKLPNVYLANIQQVYPWDRGTNYAVELGSKAANLCDN